MADFINFQGDDDEGDVIIDESDPETHTVSDNEFIDDETQIDENIEDYAFTNVCRSVSMMQCRILFSNWIAVNLCSSMR